METLEVNELNEINGGDLAYDVGYAVGYGVAVATAAIVSPILFVVWWANNQ